MARRPRIHFPGACYHVILRGNTGNSVFFTGHDRTRFFLLLQEGIQRYKHRIHAYCLMTNHVHLVVQVGEVALSGIIQNLSFRYTRYINSQKGQTGHLFQGRYKALLIDADSYLLQLVRYIHNNPVRAGMVTRPGEYPWSSHRAYLGEISVPWLTTDFVLQQFSQKAPAAMKLYNNYVLEGAGETYRKDFHQGDFEGRVLGGDRFVENALGKASQEMKSLVTLEQILQVVCSHYRVTLEELASMSRNRLLTEPRAAAALLVRESRHISLKDLGEMLNRELSSMSQAAARFERKLQSSNEKLGMLESMKRDLNITY